MSSLKFSIVIPVYQAEKYLADCLSSIQKQSYPELEIILVDDGSPDASPALCDRLAAEDPRIRVIHKENGGTSSARNAGLQIASGDYVTFTDNDDYWNDPDALAAVAAQLKESGADILWHDCYVYWQDTEKLITPAALCRRANVVGKSPAEALTHLLEGGVFSTYCVWSKFFKASLIQDNNIRFPEGMRNEDTYFIGEALLKAKSFDFYEKSFYVYRKGHTGAQTSTGVKYSHLADLKKICRDLVAKIHTLSQDEATKNVLLSYIAFPYCVWLGQSKMVKDARLKEDRREMKRYKYLLRHRAHPSVKKVAVVYRFAGYWLTSCMLSFYIKKTNHLK